MALSSNDIETLIKRPKVVEVDGLKTQQHSLRDVLDADDRLRARESQPCSPAQRLFSMLSRFRSAR